jgi:hypothetical protein
LGTWVSDPEDDLGVKELGEVTLEFGDDGALTYTIHLPDKDQKILLRYEAEDGMITTDQPSQPKIEKTSYAVTSDGRLTLWFGGQRSVYIRGR